LGSCNEASVFCGIHYLIGKVLLASLLKMCRHMSRSSIHYLIGNVLLSIESPLLKSKASII